MLSLGPTIDDYHLEASIYGYGLCLSGKKEAKKQLNNILTKRKKNKSRQFKASLFAKKRNAYFK